jgi:hypothetical protein
MSKIGLQVQQIPKLKKIRTTESSKRLEQPKLRNSAEPEDEKLRG